jgi:hypothetical protein
LYFSPPFVSATVLHKPIILIASLVPFLQPLSVAAINGTSCNRTVIGGPCPSVVTQFFVWAIFISNKWSVCAGAGVGLLCFYISQDGAERCFVVLLLRGDLDGLEMV